MKAAWKKWSGLMAGSGMIVVVALVLVLASRVFAADTTVSVYPPDRAPFGMSYGDWSAAWWQWAFSVPVPESPFHDNTGAFCGTGQSAGPVFSLVGSLGGTVARKCTVPAGKAIFFPIINLECSSMEDAPFTGDNEAELRACAAGFADGIDKASLKVKVDKTYVKGITGFRAQSPIVNITVPDNNVFNIDTSVKGHTGTLVSDGYWVMLKPLKPGKHTIHFEGACLAQSPCDGYSQSVTYTLTVKP